MGSSITTTAGTAGISFPYEHALYGRVERLADAPLLTPDRLAEHMDSHPVDDDVTAFGECPRCYFQTSGTSGTSKQVPYSAADLERQIEHEARSFAVAGLAPGDVVLTLAAPPPSLSAWATIEGSKRLGAELVNSSYVDFDAPIDTGASERATFVFGTPLMLESIGETCVETWGSVAAAFPNLRRGILYGDLLPAALERRIAALWGIDVQFLYGSVEADVIAMSCPAGDGSMHVMDEKVLVELLPEQRAGAAPATHADLIGASAAEAPLRGEVVVSDLQRDYLPLIRYRTGDMVETVPGACPCGRAGVRLRVLGRRKNAIDLGGATLHEAEIHALVEQALGTAWSDWSATVAGNGGSGATMTLRVEADGAAADAGGQLAAAFQELGVLDARRPLGDQLTVALVSSGHTTAAPTGDAKANRIAFA